ncbi:PREDICTED: ACT domain-containing protein ACR10 isoform X2 [Tarenaya hassleriana]|uniref:ACT domain-containing protein ACR10 isoform X1 n=1 Tax=Tarenaya hassleriana TaxID=28532 RepID=UPI00053C1826|nr:PREDICTED: ACT domain-containing protein ACR10 isoform X1 [Tarenaya hassleriana]XP_010530482.1 PREDICTED: ACT domain-containing protein ACR10 isoform X2 [Tarenaya hassleriana]
MCGCPLSDNIQLNHEQQAKLRTFCHPRRRNKMGILVDDVVIIRQSEKEGDPSVITVNCPDKTGLGCDLCRILLFFGLNIVRGDVSTDGKWCYVVFWVMGKPNTRWNLLKKRLVGVCPSCSSASGISYYRNELQIQKPPDVFLLKLCCFDRKGLLYDVTEALCELELNVKKVKVSTTPDGKVMDLFFLTDTRELLGTKKRQEEAYQCLRNAIGDLMISYNIELVGPEITAHSQASSSVASAVTETVFPLDENHKGLYTSGDVSIAIDNSLSPAHTLFQISCQDHKGLLYDIMRTLKDYNIKISYGRFTFKKRRNCEIDLFIVQSDGRKILDTSKQNALTSRLKAELEQPLKVAMMNRGPDTELLVANPVELSGKGRPLVFHDITVALKKLNTCIFSAEIGRHVVGDREWEVYRVLIEEEDGPGLPRGKIEEQVWKTLMGWD